LRKCPKCNSKDIVLGNQRGFRLAICDECDHEWKLK